MSQLTPNSTRDLKSKTKIHSQDSIPSFIRKTYDILDEHKFPDVIDWNSEGTAIVIKKPSEFCQKVLPTYFKHNNLTSFVRQLNMYNFHKRRTQNLDHVYFHELFQRGKKHLLKEIKRKNHENGADKGQKLGEAFEDAQNGKDLSSVYYENQLLKRLYNDAMSKINTLENQVKDLSNQNESLWTKIYQQTGREAPFGKQISKLVSKSELTQDQLPMTFGEVIIPPLKLPQDSCAHRACSMSYPKVSNAFGNVNCFLSFTNEETGESTEVSHTSPSLQLPTESDKCFDFADVAAVYTETPGQTMQLPTISLDPSYKPNELMIGKETSIGNLFDSWNFEQQNEEPFCFADQKSSESQSVQDDSVLGKRPFETTEGQESGVQEPTMKRETSLFFKRGLFSQGLEDFGAQEIDLMDFNQPFSFAKAS